MVLLLIFVALAARAVWGVYAKERESLELRKRAEADLSELQLREANLRADIAALKTDRGLEAAIREEYGMGREGEQLVVIVDPPEPAPREEDPWPFKALRWAFPLPWGR